MRAAAALLLLGAAAISGGRADPAPGPLAPDTVWIGSYDGAIAELGRLLQRRPIPSPELAAWMTENKLNRGFSWNAGERSYGEALETFRSCAGLAAWPGTEAGTTEIDFAWHRPGRESSADLLAYLTHQAMPKGDPTLLADDTPWDRQFDALLSVPENYPRAWRVRATALSYEFFRFERQLLYAGPFLDAKGGSHALIVQDHPVMAHPGAGRADYYVFDARGHLECAGAFDTGNRIDSLSAYANADKTMLTLTGWFNGMDECDQSFALDAAGLTPRSGHDLRGKPEAGFNGFGKPLYAVPMGP